MPEGDVLGPALKSFEDFAAWVREMVADGSPVADPSPIEQSTLIEEVVPDPFDLLRILVAVEHVVESPFPTELLDFMATFDDLYHFTVAKARRPNGETETEEWV
jgi:hypothetical protein